MELFQKIEALTGQKMEKFEAEQDAALVLLDGVNEAQRIATMQVQETGNSRLTSFADCVCRADKSLYYNTFKSCSRLKSTIEIPFPCCQSFLLTKYLPSLSDGCAKDRHQYQVNVIPLVSRKSDTQTTAALCCM